MLKDKMVESLNSQMNAELYSAYLYLSMEAYFESNDLSGFRKLDESTSSRRNDARHEIL